MSAYIFFILMRFILELSPSLLASSIVCRRLIHLIFLFSSLLIRFPIFSLAWFLGLKFIGHGFAPNIGMGFNIFNIG